VKSSKAVSIVLVSVSHKVSPFLEQAMDTVINNEEILLLVLRYMANSSQKKPRNRVLNIRMLVSKGLHFIADYGQKVSVFE
jgi:hypothetical protein